MNCKKCDKKMSDTPFCPICGAKQAVTDKKKKSRGNGQGSVYKRGKTYTSAVAMKNPYTGKIITKTKGGFHTEEAANDYLQELSNELNLAIKDFAVVEENERLSPLLVNYDLSLEAMWNGYRSTSDYVNLYKNTKSAYNTAWNKLEEIHKTDIRALSVTQMTYIIALKCKTYDPAKDMKSVLSHCYKWAMLIYPQFVEANLPLLISLDVSIGCVQ